MEIKKSSRKFKRGIAIEYGLFALLIAATMVVVLLITSVSMTQKVRLRREYIERKNYLDACASLYIRGVEGKSLNARALEEQFNQNEFKVEFHVGDYELSAVYGREVILYVFFEETDEGNLKLTTYRYLYQFA